MSASISSPHYRTTGHPGVHTGRHHVHVKHVEKPNPNHYRWLEGGGREMHLQDNACMYGSP